jgi:NUDIX domain-containing protein
VKDEPNLQNIPIRLDLGARLRRAFAPDRPLPNVDYSETEKRIMGKQHPKEGYWIARYNDGPMIGELTIVRVSYNAVGLPVFHALLSPVEAHYDSKLVNIPGSTTLQACVPPRVLKLERRIDLDEALTFSQKATNAEVDYLRNALKGIAAAVEHEVVVDDPLWPEGLEGAINDLAHRMKRVDTWIRDHQDASIQDLLAFAVENNLLATLTKPDVHYVVGFLFETTGGEQKVLLIKKKRGPKHILGKWNGIGGHVEPGEAPAEAMRREWNEEVDDGDAPAPVWTRFCRLAGKGFKIDFYYATTSAAVEYKSATDEPVHLFPLRVATNRAVTETVANIPWLLDMALSMMAGAEHAAHFDVAEYGTDQEQS